MMLGDSVLDTHLHNTYLFFPATSYIWFPTIFLIVFWIIYLLTKKFLYSKKLSWIHVMLTIMLCGSISIGPFLYLFTHSYHGLAGTPRRYYDFGKFSDLNVFGRVTKTIIILTSIAAPTVYLANLFMGLYKRE